MHQQGEPAMRALVGDCDAMRAIRGEIAALAPLDTPVLILGETGTGKGLVARALHALSLRRTRPFVHADCASLSRALFESELFGHERGAFTGAVARRAGRFERAAGGSIFLDEIGELDAPMQAALLHVLQERSFERVGGDAPLAMSARVIAATHRDLRAEVRAGRFRADLYFRLDVVRLRLPPLRERAGDLPLLTRALLARASSRLALPPPRLTDSALARLAAHAWPGNVRELENALERLAIRGAGRELHASDVARALDDLEGFAGAASATAAVSLHGVLRDCGGNVARAARALGIPRTTLRRRLAEQRPQLRHHEVERDHGQHRLVDPGKAALADLVEQPAPHPAPEHHEDREQGEERRERDEREAGRAEDEELREVSERLAGRHRPDHLLAAEAQIQEEGSGQRAGRADRRVEEPDRAAEHEEAAVALELLGVRAEQQQARRPGRRQHEEPDQRARERGRELLRDREPGEAHRHERQRVPADDAALDVPPLDEAARGVRDELDDTVERDRDERVVEEQQDREQGHAAGEPEHARERRRGEGRGAEDREPKRIQTGL
jgi:transcriptional regulator with AAA-type ATPase domain